jgi:hypothetical protein
MLVYLKTSMTFEFLQKFGLYKQDRHKRFFNMVKGGGEGFVFHHFGDKRYLLFLWIMMFHKEGK